MLTSVARSVAKKNPNDDVRDNSVRDRVDDVKDTSKVGVRVMREVGGSPVVFGLRNVDLVNVIGFKSLV